MAEPPWWAVQIWSQILPTTINAFDSGDGIVWISGINTMFADALGPKVASASAGMVLAVQGRQHVLLFQS